MKKEETDTGMPPKKEEIGASYVLRAKIGPDAELNITGFFRHDVDGTTVDRALDMWMTSVKRQQAVASLDSIEMQIAQGKDQVKQMEDLLGRINVDKLSGKQLEDNENRKRALTQARAALEFNVKKHREYQKLVGNSNGHAAA